MKREPRYNIPSALLQPLWLRSRESLADDGLIYDPVAAVACRQCHLAPDCLAENIPQRQLLHATLTLQCDQRVQSFLKRYPKGWVVNVGAGLDTRFYRLDNGRCRWLELDINENLLWRQRLFHRSERYSMHCGSVTDISWLKNLPVPAGEPVMLVCEQALLNCNDKQLSRFIQAVGCRFSQMEACLVLAGDRCHSRLGKQMGAGEYQHGYSDPAQQVLNGLPWAALLSCASPLDHDCNRWRSWQRWVAKIPQLKYRLSPVLVHICA